MIHNYMYDPPSGLYFLIGENPDQYNPLWWNDGEPLWVTAEKQVSSTAVNATLTFIFET